MNGKSANCIASNAYVLQAPACRRRPRMAWPRDRREFNTEKSLERIDQIIVLHSPGKGFGAQDGGASVPDRQVRSVLGRALHRGQRHPPAWRGVSGLDELEGRAVVKPPDICACDRPTPEFRVGLQDALIVDGFATVDEFRSWLLEAIVREPLVAEVQVTALCDRMFDGGQS